MLPGQSHAGAISGSVPSGPASDEILLLTLRDAIARALGYNLATIEGGQNARIARGQRLIERSPRIYSMVLTQAQTLSYVEVYWLLAVTSAPMFLLCFLSAKNEPGAGGKVPMD